MNMQELNQKARWLKCLGHPVRLSVAMQLLDGEKCVCRLVSPMEIQAPTMSRHLATLKAARIVKTRKDGAMIFYSLATPAVVRFVRYVASTSLDS